VSVTLVESDPRMAGLARASLDRPENGALAPRLRLVEADLLGGRDVREAAGLFDGAFDTVLTNPPFHPAGGRASPDPLRRAAREMPEADFLQRWLAAAAALLAAGGLLLLVARPDNLQAVLEAASNRYGDIRVRPVHPRPERRASRLLLSARRGSKAPFQLLPPVVLQDGEGRPTPIAEAIGEGRATIGFEI
jgi:tRNA1(Val) A37 N6-methylase TrmN6